MEQYIKDLAIFGTNEIGMVGPGSFVGIVTHQMDLLVHIFD